MADATTSGLAVNTSSYDGYAATNKLLATATNTPENLNQWLMAARQGQALTASQFALSQQHLAALNGQAASILADPTTENATQRINDAMKMGVLSQQDGANELQTISSLGGDPAKIAQYGYRHLGTIMSAQQLMQQRYGDPSTIDNGQTITPVTVRTGPQAGVYAAGGSALQKYMSPGEAASPVPVPQADGTILHTTMRGFGQQAGDTAGLPPTSGAPGPAPMPPPGYSGLNNPGSYVDPRRAAASGVSIGPDGRPVYGDTPQLNPPPVPAGTQPGDVIQPGPVGSRGMGHPVVAGPGLAGAALQGGAPQPTVPGVAGPSPMLGAGLKAYQDDQASASAKMDGVRSLTQALPLVQQLGATGSGPGTAAFQKAKSTLVSAGILSPDTPDVAAYDEAKKYLSQYVSKSALAGRSDMGQLQAQASSPNLETSNAATLALAQNAIAADRMDAARPKAFEATGNDNLASYGQFKAGYTQGQDLRAYKIDLMPQADRMALIAQMKAKKDTPEGQRFWRSLQNAHNAGVLTGLPTGDAGGQ